MAKPTRRTPVSNATEESLFITAPDGLKLHTRAYGSRLADRTTIVCLPGLSRTAADFEVLARGLSLHPKHPRRVLAIDYRGRGQSDYDRDPANYSLAVELNDVMSIVTALAAAPAVFVGSSRGGILTMLLAAARPTMVAGAILNDIGPVIELEGLLRIKSYVGRLPAPTSGQEGADMLRRLSGSQFPNLTPEDWLAAAERTWQARNGAFVPTYDPSLARTLDGIDPAQPLPPLWNEFDALAGVPIMSIRGANSDILSRATVTAMKKRRADLETIEVPDQGHTPLLAEPALIRQIAAFAARCDNLISHS